jgi:hypothetical protein
MDFDFERVIHHEPNRGSSAINHYTGDIPAGIYKLTVNGTGVVIRNTAGQEVHMKYSHPDQGFFFELDHRDELDFVLDTPNGEMSLFIYAPQTSPHTLNVVN